MIGYMYNNQSIELSSYNALMPLQLTRQKICTKQNLLRSTVHGPQWLAYVLRRGRAGHF